MSRGTHEVQIIFCKALTLAACEQRSRDTGGSDSGSTCQGHPHVRFQSPIDFKVPFNLFTTAIRLDVHSKALPLLDNWSRPPSFKVEDSRLTCMVFWHHIAATKMR